MICYYFCYILSDIEPVKMNAYQIFNIHYISLIYVITFVVNDS
jgi:hypothetical protein